MKKSGIWIVLIIIIAIVGIFYFDFFNLTYSKEKTLASIIHYEDARWVSDELIRNLSDRDPEIRARAALAVGRIGEPKGTNYLFDLLHDSVDVVAETAAFAIGLSDEKEYARELMAVCEGFAPSIQVNVIQAAGRLADSTMPDVADEISTYLDHTSAMVREQAVYAIWRCDGKAYADGLKIICLNDPIRPVQIAALYSLVRMNIADAVEVYTEWLPDSDPFVRSLALRGLGLGKDDRLTKFIAAGLNDRNNNVVSQSVASLGAIGSDRAINYIIGR